MPEMLCHKTIVIFVCLIEKKMTHPLFSASLTFFFILYLMFPNIQLRYCYLIWHQTVTSTKTLFPWKIIAPVNLKSLSFINSKNCPLLKGKGYSWNVLLRSLHWQQQIKTYPRNARFSLVRKQDSLQETVEN